MENMFESTDGRWQASKAYARVLGGFGVHGVCETGYEHRIARHRWEEPSRARSVGHELYQAKMLPAAVA